MDVNPEIGQYKLACMEYAWLILSGVKNEISFLFGRNPENESIITGDG